MAIILGVDPGSRITGYGIIQVIGKHSQYVASGCIRLETYPMPQRLTCIYQSLQSLITQYAPEEAAVEEIFFARNAESALKLGQARGAAIVAAANLGLSVWEYSTRKVKQAIVGTGAASKQQVQHMICTLLKLKEAPQLDATDALAVALCHAHTRQSLIRLATVKGFRRGRLK